MKVIQILLPFLCVSCFAQTNIEQKEIMSNEPEIVKLKWDKPKSGEAIRYYFPDYVDSVLTEIVVNNKGLCWVIELSKKQDTTELHLFRGDSINNEETENSNSDYDLLVNSTNRFYKTNKGV